MKQKNVKIAFCSLGCKVNQYETNAMMQDFIKNGYIIEEFENKADVYVVNTCTVTNIADRKSRQMLRRVKDLNPESIIVACGCYVQVAKAEIEKIEEIDIIIGNNEKKNIVKYVEERLKNKEIIKEEISDVLQQKEYIEFGPTTFTEKTRAVVKIQDGCDRFCSYCIIPYARGRVRSRNINNIIEEVKSIAEKGIKEIVLTGIHIASYGKDFNYEVKLIDLLEKLNEIQGIERIRLGSLEPTIITEEFVEKLSKLKKVCEHFHLSLQSGCDDTLKRMNRRYTTEEFYKCTQILRKYYKEPTLTTDIIVGFPGETEQEFKLTCDFLEKINFYKMHIFKYSQRKGTKAAIMPNQVDGKIKEERSKILIDLSNKNQVNYNNKKIGCKVEVLYEEREDEYFKGHTKDYYLVKMKTMDNNLENEIQKVDITGAKCEFLIAE